MKKFNIELWKIGVSKANEISHTTHVEVESIHVKSYDSETHSMADMAKKTFFAFLGIFWGIFRPKKLN